MHLVVWTCLPLGRYRDRRGSNGKVFIRRTSRPHHVLSTGYDQTHDNLELCFHFEFMEFFSNVGGDSLEPSLFELVAQEQLRDLLQPAVKYVLAVCFDS